VRNFVFFMTKKLYDRKRMINDLVTIISENDVFGH